MSDRGEVSYCQDCKATRPWFRTVYNDVVCTHCGWSRRFNPLHQQIEALTAQRDTAWAQLRVYERQGEVLRRCECELCKGRIETPKTVAERVDELERQCNRSELATDHMIRSQPGLRALQLRVDLLERELEDLRRKPE